MKITYVKLDEGLRFDALKPYAARLPAERQQKIARYRFEQDKLLSLAAGLLIRRAVGESALYFGAHGKPYAENGVWFSVSHSGRIAAIAVSENEVGLDVEQIPDESRLKFAERFCHPGEQAYIAAADDKRLAFCEIWTRKEAYLKMTGEGITTELSAFDTAASSLREQLYTTAGDGYCLSACSEKAIDKDTVNISKLELKELL